MQKSFRKPAPLYLYTPINRRDTIQPAFATLLALADVVLAVDQEIVVEAKQIVLSYPQLSDRDAVHQAVMRRHGIDRILGFATGIDGVPGITRIT